MNSRTGAIPGGSKSSEKKTTAVIFSNKIDPEQGISLKFKNEIIKFDSTVKFLGVNCDRWLTWKAHIQYVINRCNERMNLLRADKKTLLTLYRTLIRSVVDYGSIAYDNASKTTKKLLDQIQSKALRICCGAMMMTPIAAMQVDCGETSLELRRKELQLQYAAKLHASVENPTKSIIEVRRQNNGNHQPGKEPFAMKTSNLNQIISHAEIAIKNDHTDHPPWKLAALKINSSLAETVKRTSNIVAERKRLAEMKINEYSRSMQIFTDASKKDDGRAGISFQIPSKNINFQCRLSNNTSIFTAEACAILEALKYIDGDEECGDVSIFSNSLEVVNALAVNTSKKSTNVIKDICNITYHLQQKGSTGINIVWIPGHAGIRGNERAHEAASAAKERNDIDAQHPLTYDEINILIKRHINQLWQDQWERIWERWWLQKHRTEDQSEYQVDMQKPKERSHHDKVPIRKEPTKLLHAHHENAQGRNMHAMNAEYLKQLNISYQNARRTNCLQMISEKYVEERIFKIFKWPSAHF